MSDIETATNDNKNAREKLMTIIPKCYVSELKNDHIYMCSIRFIINEENHINWNIFMWPMSIWYE